LPHFGEEREAIVAVEERDYVSGRFLREIREITADEWNARHGR
jgi:hypothetical protein